MQLVSKNLYSSLYLICISFHYNKNIIKNLLIFNNVSYIGNNLLATSQSTWIKLLRHCHYFFFEVKYQKLAKHVQQFLLLYGKPRILFNLFKIYVYISFIKYVMTSSICMSTSAWSYLNLKYKLCIHCT